MVRIRTPHRLLAAGIALGVIASGGVFVSGGESASAASLPAAERYAPSRVPDRITLTPGMDPTTQQVVSWRTSTEVAEAVVEYRTLTPEPYPGGVLAVTAQSSTDFTTDLGYAQTTHSATLESLLPGVAYMYRVGDGTNFSEWQDFETSATPDDRFSFIFLGDIQNDILSDTSRVLRNAFRDRPNADMVVQIGDLVNDAHSDEQWGELYEAFSYPLGTMNMLTTPGNHEYEGALSSQWGSQFAYPANGPQGEGEVYDKLKGTVYYTDNQGVRFISLNSNITDTEGLAVQAAWLDGVLAENTQAWSVVFFHHPVYSLDEGRNNLGIRQSWGPILEKHNVDLVLSGHDHAYGRGNLLANEQNLPAEADPNLSSTGPVYVSASAGTKFYNVGPRHWNENDAHLRRLVPTVQTYQVIDVSSGTLRFESKTADGVFLDGFTITKSEGNKLVVDGVAPQVIDPGTPPPCLGCGENPDPGPTDPEEPEVPGGDFFYESIAHLTSVNRSNAALPAGAVYAEESDLLYLGDQNRRTIFEIDPDTDTVLRTMELPENIRDLGIDEERKLLYVGQQNRNWVVVSLADEDYGQVVRGPFSIIESNRSLDVDPVGDLVYAAVPARGVEVFQASTGTSLGVIKGTADSYYVAADPESGIIVTTKFASVEGARGLQAFDSRNGFVKLWERSVRPNARQVDIDSTNGVLYVGYTGTGSDGGGFSVHDLRTGAQLADMVGPEYGKDGYGIAVDDERQRVFVANRDFRLNPPGQELTAAAITVSARVVDPVDPTDPVDPVGPPDPGEPGVGAYESRPLTSIPSAETTELEPEVRPVGTAVDPVTGHLYVADEMRPARVHVIDPVSDKVLRTLTVPTADPLGDGMRDLAYADGKVYVGYGSNWLVMDAQTGAAVREPMTFAGGVRGIDVDVAGGRVFGATRGTGFEVMDATTGDEIRVVMGPEDGGAWRTHGIAYDAEQDLIYVSNSDASGSTEGIRVYRGSDYTLIDRFTVADADYRSIAVDSKAKLVVVGHQTSEFDNSGVTVLATTDFAQIARLNEYRYGDKVYGVSIDAERNLLYVSARERYPAGIIQVTLPKK